jgi:hypothetical protein
MVAFCLKYDQMSGLRHFQTEVQAYNPRWLRNIIACCSTQCVTVYCQVDGHWDRENLAGHPDQFVSKACCTNKKQDRRLV